MQNVSETSHATVQGLVSSCNKSEHVETNYTLQYKHNSSVDLDELDHNNREVNYFISSGIFFVCKWIIK